MSQRLASALLRRARNWAGQLTSFAKSYAPTHLKSKIRSSAKEIEPGRIQITINVRGKDARAQEYGSGLHSQKRAKKKYIIKPKVASFLEFQGTNEFDGWLIRTSLVEHPGIHAVNNEQGYVRPAIKEIRAKARKDLSKDIREAIFGDLKQSFSGAKK